MSTLRKIISGGQTGADMGGLLAAKELGLETGGTAAKYYMTEDGSRLILKTKYGLTAQGTYAERTYHNINSSDATVVFGNITSQGSGLTVKLCQDLGKPYIHNPGVIAFFKFLTEHNVEILNVAGNRESRNPGIERRVREYLVEALS